MNRPWSKIAVSALGQGDLAIFAVALIQPTCFFISLAQFNRLRVEISFKVWSDLTMDDR
eukprot:CAMPEP_0113714930 /NCGR_PEP_ID=MMETSP0038_2-20120614/32935_1 /TAXON_ID=2898 /ORGANISM="Cryptomonas paramecium" /LENGTH=58 /DNA_ID=CAMNT_0000642051 /DNA_START=179 /DNA_END=351 /DNA_ORIENTATION=+ /assembly_acc=CAM_ASM_000170